jgi:hypothetical protein
LGGVCAAVTHSEEDSIGLANSMQHSIVLQKYVIAEHGKKMLTLLKPIVYYRLQKNPPLDSILSRFNPVRFNPPYQVPFKVKDEIGPVLN